jgi:hypothetical protein
MKRRGPYYCSVKPSLRTVVRAGFVALVVGSLLVVGSAYATDGLGDTPTEAAEQRYAVNDSQPIVPPLNGTTVIAGDSNTWTGRESENPRSKGELVAFDPDGSVRYYDDTHTRYWDVDPVPGTEATVEYAYADHSNASECPDFGSAAYHENSAYAGSVDRSTWLEYARANGEASDGACTFNSIERANLSTGEVTPVYATPTPGKEATRWHDADRINGTHLAIADIYLDRVFVVDTRTNEIPWSWSPARDDPEAFAPNTSGGPYPTDWTHMNDVEVLEDGRLMASPRNNDRVVFLDPSRSPSEALQGNWTIGSENDYSTLYEQHNPDYIPASQGGPAVLIADSENNRVVEYQRENGEWNRTWTWTDSRAQWIRDADRLPNGNTLVADSNGDRVFEINRQGEIIWSTEVAFPYEAERFETGDESTDGRSARSLGLPSNEVGPIEGLWIAVKDVLSGPAFSALQYVSPYWMGFAEIGAVLVLVVTTIVWLSTEVWWRVVPRVRRAASNG